MPRPSDASLEDSLSRLRRAMEDAPGAAEEVATRAAVVEVEKRFRKKLRQIVLAVGVTCALFLTATIIITTTLFGAITQGARQDAVRDAAVARNQETIDAFQAQLDAANIQLKAQGLPQVPAPVMVQPGSPEQAQLITAAGTASTLASLPREVIDQPSAPDLAKAVADYVSANHGLFAPSPDAVIDGVAAYFVTNPPPAGEKGDKGDPCLSTDEACRGPQGEQGVQGEKGEKGDPGPPPTAAEIRAAFRDEINSNPQVLCPLGGTFGPQQVALAGGGSITQFACFADETPPDDEDDTEMPTPTPTTTPTTTPETTG